jgi:hypothetical protein
MLPVENQTVRRKALALILFLLLAPLPRALRAAEPTKNPARASALVFGQALERGDPSLLRAILPQQGKVQLRLLSLGPGNGFFSAGQVESLVRDFLDQGALRSFRLAHVEQDTDRYALARGQAEITDRHGRSRIVELQLALQLEDKRWVLREIRETPS